MHEEIEDSVVVSSSAGSWADAYFMIPDAHQAHQLLLDITPESSTPQRELRKRISRQQTSFFLSVFQLPTYHGGWCHARPHVDVQLYARQSSSCLYTNSAMTFFNPYRIGIPIFVPSLGRIHDTAVPHTCQ